MKKKTISIILSISFIGGSLIYLLISGFDDTIVYYKTVDELLANPKRFETNPVRINGVLTPGSVQMKKGTNEYHFQLTKRKKILKVKFLGILPDTMQENNELIVHGVFDSQKNIFIASEILTKCPSKYEAEAKAIK